MATATGRSINTAETRGALATYYCLVVKEFVFLIALPRKCLKPIIRVNWNYYGFLTAARIIAAPHVEGPTLLKKRAFGK